MNSDKYTVVNNYNYNCTQYLNGECCPSGPSGLSCTSGCLPCLPCSCSSECPQCPSGPSGPSGPAGNDGSDGPSGPAGNDGAIGPSGPSGQQGSNGSSGPSGPSGSAGGVNGSNAIIVTQNGMSLLGSVTGPSSSYSSNEINKMNQVLLVSASSPQYAMLTFNQNPGSVAAVDVSNSASPTYISPGVGTTIINSPGGANNGPIMGVISGNYYFVGTNSGYLYVFNLSTLPTITTVSQTFKPDTGDAGGLFAVPTVTGATVYLASETSGNLYVINFIASPFSISTTYTVAVSSALIGVCVSGNYAYVSDYTNQRLAVYALTVNDVPSNPTLVTTLALPNEPGYIALHPNGNTLYICQFNGPNLWIVDIAAPINPYIVTTLQAPLGGNFGFGAVNVVFRSPIAYVGNSTGGYNVYNASIPEAPILQYTLNCGSGFATNGFDADNSGNIYVPNRAINTYPPNVNVLSIFGPTSTALTATVYNSVLVSALVHSYGSTSVPNGSSISWTFNNVVGVNPATSGETANGVSALKTTEPLILPIPTGWSLSATVTTVSTNLINVIVSYTNNTGSSQTIPYGGYDVSFVVAYQ